MLCPVTSQKPSGVLPGERESVEQRQKIHQISPRKDEERVARLETLPDCFHGLSDHLPVRVLALFRCFILCVPHVALFFERDSCWETSPRQLMFIQIENEGVETLCCSREGDRVWSRTIGEAGVDGRSAGQPAAARETLSSQVCLLSLS